MKRINLLLLTLLFSLYLSAQNTETSDEQKTQTVEVSCGQCKFGMKEKQGCDLAARINGKSYFIEGTAIDEHGDAHASEGFCNAIRKAEVKGKIVSNTFIVSEFKLLPTKSELRKRKREK